MQKITHGYKVVYQDVYNNLESVYARCLTMGIHYQLNQWSFPCIKDSKLFAFKTLQDARCFINSYVGTVSDMERGHYHIYEADLLNPQRPTLLLSVGWLTSSRLRCVLYQRQQHKRFRNYFYMMPKCDIPRGTVQCDAIRLTQVINQ